MGAPSVYAKEIADLLERDKFDHAHQRANEIAMEADELDAHFYFQYALSAIALSEHDNSVRYYIISKMEKAPGYSEGMKADLYFEMAMRNLRTHRRLEAATEVLRDEVRDIYAANPDRNKRILVDATLARLYFARGRYKEAWELHEQADFGWSQLPESLCNNTERTENLFHQLRTDVARGTDRSHRIGLYNRLERAIDTEEKLLRTRLWLLQNVGKWWLSLDSRIWR